MLKIASTWNEEGDHKGRKFMNAIVQYSDNVYLKKKSYQVTSEIFEEALKSWDYSDGRQADGDEEIQCCCTHPIFNINIFENKNTKIKIYCGSCCIKKFAKDSLLNQQLDSFSKMFRTMKKIEKADEFPKRFTNALDKLEAKYFAEIDNLFEEESAKVIKFFDNCKQRTCNFGKYKGITYLHIIATNKTYIKWYGDMKKTDNKFNIQDHYLDQLYKLFYK